MSRHQHHEPGFGLRATIGLFLCLMLPAAFALRSVAEPRPIVPVTPEITPYGYTRSLLLFAFPLVILLAWFLAHPDCRIPRRAFALTLIFLVPAGFLLDYLRGAAFFAFPNRAATLGVWVPVVGGSVPVEEFAFYLSGFFVILLTYVWCDEVWFAAYNIPSYRAAAADVRKVVQFHWPSLAVGLVLAGAALLYKRNWSPAPGPYPGYVLFLIAVAIVPSLFLFPTARPFINWRAYSFTAILLLLVSLFWEATLALPYQWWAFHPDQMLGLEIKAWSRLPIEEPILWMAVTFATVVWYEAMKIFVAMERPLLDALFRARPGADPISAP